MLNQNEPKNHRNISAQYKGIKFINRIRKDPLNFFVRLMEEHGSHVWYDLMGKKVLLLNDASAIEQVFQENFKKYRKARFNDVLKPLLGNGIFLSEGGTWFKQRRESAPAFANKHFPEMLVQMTAAVESMFKRWDEKIAKEEPINLDLETMWFTLDVVLRALFHEERDDVAKGVKDSLGILLKDAEKRIWALASFPQSITLKLSKYQRASKFLDELVKDLIETRRLNVIKLCLFFWPVMRRQRMV
jgi:cytochrome P450